MKKIIPLLLLIHVSYSTLGQKVQATVSSGAHLILTTNWGVFTNSTISVEHLDGTNKHVYNQPPFNYNPNAMYVPGLDSDFAQNVPVVVYIVRPLIKVVSAPKNSATVNSVNQLVSSADWSKYSTGKILVEEADGRNQHIYSAASSRTYTSNSLAVTGLSADFSSGTVVNVYDIDFAVLSSDGSLSVNTTSFDNPLSVKGKIRAQEIKVETANWPDYVFAKNYQLPSLQETEQHIKDKGHLPGIPSAEEVKTNGIDLGEMNAKLLKKIEELTLHLIEMKKENDLRNEKQEKEIEKLKANTNRKE